jgi:hypothetical protein
MRSSRVFVVLFVAPVSFLEAATGERARVELMGLALPCGLDSIRVVLSTKNLGKGILCAKA